LHFALNICLLLCELRVLCGEFNSNQFQNRLKRSWICKNRAIPYSCESGYRVSKLVLGKPMVKVLLNEVVVGQVWIGANHAVDFGCLAGA
jgi:hypothetical protein